MQSNFEGEIFLTNAMIFQNISHYLQYTVAVQRERDSECVCVCVCVCVRAHTLKQPSYTASI